VTKHLANKETNMTHNSKSKVVVILLAMATLALASMACNVEPGDGKVADAVIDGNYAIKDAAAALDDAVGGPTGIELDTHGTVIIDGLWDIAKDIAEGE
jgi:hypothetical protein